MYSCDAIDLSMCMWVVLASRFVHIKHRYKSLTHTNLSSRAFNVNIAFIIKSSSINNIITITIITMIMMIKMLFQNSFCVASFSHSKSLNSYKLNKIKGGRTTLKESVERMREKILE